MSSSIQSQAARTIASSATTTSNTTQVTRVLVADRFENGALSCRIDNATMRGGTMIGRPSTRQESIICVTYDRSAIIQATAHSYNPDTGRSENFDPELNFANFDDEGNLQGLTLLDQATEDPSPRRSRDHPGRNRFFRYENAFVAVLPLRDAKVNKWWIPRRINSRDQDGPIPPWTDRDEDTDAGGASVLEET